MRIALLSDATMPSPTPGTHGLGLVAWQVAEGLRSRGHDVTLIAKQGSQFSGVLIMPPDANGYEGEKLLAAAALRAHQQWNYDAFLDMGHLHHLSLIVPHLPIVNVYHDNYQPVSRCPILLSYGQQAMLSPKFDRARVIWNSLNPADFQPRYDNITEPYALFIGAMSELKQPLLAIEAAARMGLKLLMAGQPVFGKVPITEHSNVEYVGMVTGSVKAELYRNARVLLQLGIGEAFGLTTLEAGLCFPYDTQIVACDITNGIKSLYTGAMIKIMTDNGSVEATQDHPIWTKRGWIKAKNIVLGDEILYTSECCDSKRKDNDRNIQEVYSGSIGDIVSGLQNDALKRGSSSGWNVPSSGTLATPSGWNVQADGIYIPFEACNCDRHRTCLYCRTNRWGRDNYDTRNEKRKDKAIGEHSQYILPFDGMVASKITAEILLYCQETQTGTSSSECLCVSDRGAFLSPFVQSAGALFNYKTRAHDTDDRMGRNTNDTTEDGNLQREANKYHAVYPTAKYQPITKIETRYVTELPVYNVTTQSGTYLAQGLLVHNCGTPVVGWPYGGTLDLVRNGVNGILVSATAKDKVQAVCSAIQKAWYLPRTVCRAYTETLCNNERQIDLYEQALAACAKGSWW